jgi:iron-sulfur cluster repair protein YtfE (RIC family)
MNAFNLLKTDHQKVAGLFQQLERASGKKKLDVFQQIKTELELHAHIEEQVFYPALEEPSETHDLTLEAYEEHAAVKKLLRELSRGRNANDEWQAKAKVLQENVEHHVDEEENELFKQARQALSDEEIEELGTQLALEKQRKQGTASARASASKSSNKTSKARKAASSKKTAGKKKPASKASKKAAKKAGRSKKSAGSKSARASK